MKEREEPKERKARGIENDRVSRKGEGEGKSEGKCEKGERKGDGGGEKRTMSAKSKDKEHSASSHSYSQSQGGTYVRTCVLSYHPVVLNYIFVAFSSFFFTLLNPTIALQE